MLAEMGVRVWLPSDTLPKANSAEAAPAQANQGPASTLRQAQGEREAGANAMSLPVRREPPLRLPVLDTPPAAANAAPTRYVIGNLPTQPAAFDLVLLGEPCTGDAERLLANMMKTLSGNIFVAQMVAAQNHAQDAATVLADQLVQIPAKVIVALGPHAAKALLGEAATAVPFGKLRGFAHPVEGLSSQAIATYHPLQLLRQPRAKAQAWTDLQLAMKVAKARGGADKVAIYTPLSARVD